MTVAEEGIVFTAQEYQDLLECAAERGWPPHEIVRVALENELAK